MKTVSNQLWITPFWLKICLPSWIEALQSSLASGFVLVAEHTAAETSEEELAADVVFRCNNQQEKQQLQQLLLSLA